MNEGGEPTNDIENDIVRVLVSEGASMVGFADITEVPVRDRQHMDSAVWFAVALDPRVVADIISGPTKLYEIEYRRKNELLRKLGRTATKMLRLQGFEAIPRLATDEDIDWIDLVTPLPHKTVATRAGMGWIGKCGLLVTREYGSAIRMAVVLTDAFFEGGQPIGVSYCGDCRKCVEACPAGAPTGEDWYKRADRSDFYDAFACHEHIIQLQKEKALGAKICGICMAVCPWTQKYVKRELED